MSGKTLIEAEKSSAAGFATTNPKIEPSQKCSNQRYLGYYWKDAWFELDVETSQMRHYSMKLRTASPTGTKIKVQTIAESGDLKTLATIDVPNTRSWTDYTMTKGTTLSLPQGAHTLRFSNLVDGANIDYLTFSAGADDDTVAIQPATNDGPDINPLKGFSSGWSRTDEDYASVGFQYIEWGKLEPKDDFFDWDYVEETLDQHGTKGRHFILQLVVDWDGREPVEENYLGPDWLLDQVGQNEGPADQDAPDSRLARATRYNDPIFIAEAVEAIQALLGYLKEDPRQFVMQVGVLGYWGQWHTFPREDWAPTKFTKFAIQEAYMKNMGPDGLTQIRDPGEPVSPPQKGMGYTNGNAVPTKYGYEFGEAIDKGQLWKKGPIHGAWPPNVEPDHWDRFFLKPEGEYFIGQGRYSTLLSPPAKEISEQLPGWKQDGLFMKMHRQMGYNFQAKAVRHLVGVDDSHQIHIEIDLHNIGVAPFYKNWDIQLAVLNAETATVVGMEKLDADLRELGPTESITLKGSVTAAIDLDEDYQIGFRILQPGADETKGTAWKLKPRNTYVLLANDIDAVQGVWNENNALQGGWNILANIERRLPDQTSPLEGDFFPFQGSFRPVIEK